jgi:sugar phosphate isomerase/epimerase
VSMAQRGEHPTQAQLAFNSATWSTTKPEDAMRQLAEIGYGAVELGAHPQALPPSALTSARATALRQTAGDAGLRIAAFNLTAPDLLGETRHEPSLISPQAALRSMRIELVRCGIEFAAEAGTDLLVISSGHTSADITRLTAICHLIDGLEVLVEEANQAGIKIALKPLPFSLIDSYRAYLEIWRAFEDSPLGLCLDMASAYCAFEDLDAVIADAPALLHVHVADMQGRDGRHLIPGKGEIRIASALRALRRRGYSGAVTINLPDHSLDPRWAAQVARSELLKLWPNAGTPDRPDDPRAAPCQ